MKKSFFLSAFILFLGVSLVGQAYPDRHSTSYTDAWISCVEAESPNIKRDPGHWIMYDFGDQYALHNSKIWNFNVPDSTSRGMKDIIVDYSNDGETWIEVSEFTVPQAPGSTIYEGVAGPDFDGVVARYVLVSIIDTHGDTECAAMSELRIDATVSTSTNIPDGELDVEVKASPNPASEFTVISIGQEIKDLKYSLSDMSGRLLREGNIPNSEFRLNTSNLMSGTYSLSIYNQEGTKSILVNVINK